MSTAIVLYERWAVDDPVLDCAIFIVDYHNLRTWACTCEVVEGDNPYCPVIREHDWAK